LNPIMLYQCGSRVLFSPSSYFFKRPLLQCMRACVKIHDYEGDQG